MNAPTLAQYRKDYNRGWAVSERAVDGALDAADGRNEPSAWYDGYMDSATGREKWHYLDCDCPEHERDDKPVVTHRIMISPRVWSFLEGTQAWADHRSGSGGSHPDDQSLIAKVHDAPTPTRKDGRFPVDLTRGELDAFTRYMEAFREGAADNTWDADGRADLFAANAILAAIGKARA